MRLASYTLTEIFVTSLGVWWWCESRPCRGCWGFHDKTTEGDEAVNGESRDAIEHVNAGFVWLCFLPREHVLWLGTFG